MKITQYTAVNFEVLENSEDGSVRLQFTALMPVGPDTFLPTEVIRIPFNGESWKNFQRHVESNGNVPSIEVAKSMPVVEGI